MNSSIPQHLSDPPALLAVFHRLNRVIPENQEIITVAPETPAAEALELMARHGFSQLPIVVNKEVLGLFTYRSFARRVLSPEPDKRKPEELTVEDCVEDPVYARVTDEFRTWFDHLDQYDSILIGDPNRLQAIVTPMDILRYLYAVASPFVLLGEVELALRLLIRMAVTDEKLAECSQVALASKYEAEELPTRLDQMTFNDYAQLIGDGRCWGNFEPIFRGTRQVTRTKLEQLRDLRNVVFHFKRELTTTDFESLVQHRNWVLLKARAAQARERGT
jgi:CBS domain-containing protein